MLHNLLPVSNVCEAALNSLFWSPVGVTNGKIRALPRRRDPSLKIRARALNLFVKSEPES